MAKYLYEVSIERGRNNSEFELFHENVQNLNAKSPDFGGIQRVCLIGSHKNKSTIHMFCTENMKNSKDVVVEEITKNTIANKLHHIYLDTINNCFLEYDDYININK